MAVYVTFVSLLRVHHLKMGNHQFKPKLVNRPHHVIKNTVVWDVYVTVLGPDENTRRSLHIVVRQNACWDVSVRTKIEGRA